MPSGALLVLSLLVAVPAANAGQDPVPGKPSDPPALRIPPQSLKNEKGRDEPRGDDAEKGREVLEGGAGEKIREMLEGRGGPQPTGDPILDGVLDLLRNRGSVLDGSPLDPRSDAPDLQPLPDAGPTPGAGPTPEWVPYREGQSRPRPIPRPNPRRAPQRAFAADEASRYLLAEQLLRTARMLAAQPHGDAQRQRLIEDLRSEAARCLASEAPSPPSFGPTPAGNPIPAGHSEAY